MRKIAKIEMHTDNEMRVIHRQAVILPRIPPMPTLTMWTGLSRNYDVEDQPDLKYLPYFGDDDDEEVLSEYHQIK